MAGRVTRRRAVGNIFIERKSGIKYMYKSSIFLSERKTDANCIVAAAVPTLETVGTGLPARMSSINIVPVIVKSFCTGSDRTGIP